MVLYKCVRPLLNFLLIPRMAVFVTVESLRTAIEVPGPAEMSGTPNVPKPEAVVRDARLGQESQTHRRGQCCALRPPRSGLGLDGVTTQTRVGSGVLSDQRERPRRGITPDPVPDGESEVVQEEEHPPG